MHLLLKRQCILDIKYTWIFKFFYQRTLINLRKKLYDFLCQKVHVYVVLVVELLTLRKTKISVIWIYMHTKLIVCYSCKDTWMVSIMGKRHIHFLHVLMEAVGTIAFPQFSSQQAWWRQMLAKVTVSIKDAESILRKITFFFLYWGLKLSLHMLKASLPGWYS